MATLPFPPRAAYNSMTFQDPNGPYSDTQQNAADALHDILRNRVAADIVSGRRNDPMYAVSDPRQLELRANTPERGFGPMIARNELLKRSDAGEFAAPGFGDLGQFAGSNGGIGSFGGGISGKPGFDELGNATMAFANGGEAQMPQQGANPFADPNTMAVYDQMRQSVSPKQFGDEMLAGASQIDPRATAQFMDDLSQIDLSPEDLDMLNNMVDEILANPEQYAAVRAKYLEMGAPEELLPEQFDPQFFAAMNMAVDQMIGEPAGVQSFAMGGIAELKPIAKAIASYGRNGDTMLAHITPAEARMLRRRGGSGTINPATGLPEFFLKKAFKSLGKAIKSFASSTVGRIVTTVALGFFLGPAAASFLGATSAAGIAAVTGFVGSAGSTLLAGGNIGDALKAGAVGGLTYGATVGITGGAEAFAPGLETTPGQAFQGQLDKVSNVFSAPTTAAPSQIATDATQAPYKPLEMTGTPSKPFDSYFGSQPSTDVLRDNITANTAREAYGAELARTNPEAFYNPNVAPPAPLPGQPGSDVLIGGKPNILAIEAAGSDAYTGSLKPPVGGLQPNIAVPDMPAGTQLSRMPQSMLSPSASLPTLSGVAPPATPAVPTVGKAFSTIGEGLGIGQGNEFSFDKLMQGGKELFSPSLSNAELAQTPEYASAINSGKTVTQALADAAKLNAPGFFRSYGPATLAGLGTLGAMGGFTPKPIEESAQSKMLKGGPGSAEDLLSKNPSQFYVQYLPGVQYYNGSLRKPPGMATGGIVDAMPMNYAIGGGVDKQLYDVYTSTTLSEADKAAKLNDIITTNKVTADEIKTRFNLSDKDISYIDNSAGVNYSAPVTDTRGTVLNPSGEAYSKSDAAMYDAFRAGDYNLLNGLMATYSVTPAYIKAKFGLSDADIGYITGQGGKFSATGPSQIKTTGTGTSTIFSNTPGFSLTPGGLKTMPKTTLGGTQMGTGTGVFPAIDDLQLAAGMDANNISPQKMSVASGLGVPEVTTRYYNAKNEALLGNFTVDPATGTRTPIAARAPVAQPYNNAVALTSGLSPTGPLGEYSTRTVTPVMPDTVTGGITTLPDVSFSRPGVQRAMPLFKTDGTLGAYRDPNTATQYTPLENRLYDAFTSKNTPELNNLLSQFNVSAGAVQNRFGLTPADTTYMTTHDGVKFFTPPAANTSTTANTSAAPKLLNMGGIAGLAQGGYPRKTGQINGPGTATSDSIPAMLSDGEFVMTAKAVRGAGKGDRRAGAKRMYALMHQLEQNAARG